ncbi:MAG: hypothetical protein LBU12_07915 [Deltaproteobacteria bacterium]|jgi:hypothetical protein|nr:hypothetical protein [Deltaproteobacteria bacterium]
MRPEPGGPEKALSAAACPGPTCPLTVEINEDRFTLDNLEIEAADFAERRLEAASPEVGRPEPRILLKIGDRTVAAAVVSLGRLARQPGTVSERRGPPRQRPRGLGGSQRRPSAAAR